MKYKKFKNIIEDNLADKFAKYSQKLQNEEKETLQDIIDQLNKHLAIISQKHKKL